MTAHTGDAIAKARARRNAYIRQLAAEGASVREAARKAKCSPATASRVLRAD